MSRLHRLALHLKCDKYIMDFLWLHIVFLNEPNTCFDQLCVNWSWSSVYVIRNIYDESLAAQNTFDHIYIQHFSFLLIFGQIIIRHFLFSLKTLQGIHFFEIFRCDYLLIIQLIFFDMVPNFVHISFCQRSYKLTKEVLAYFFGITDSLFLSHMHFHNFHEGVQLKDILYQ